MDMKRYESEANASDLHSFKWPAGGNSSGSKQKSDSIKVKPFLASLCFELLCFLANTALCCKCWPYLK